MATNILARQTKEALASRPRLFRLATDVVLAVWEESTQAAAGRLVAKLNDVALPAPVSVLSLPTSWGGTRRLVLARWRNQAEESATFSIRDASDRTVLEFQAVTKHLEPLDAAGLLGGLDANGKVRVMKQAMEFARAAFSLQGNAVFAESCRRLAQDFAPQPRPLAARVRLTDRLVLCEGTLPAGFGRVLSATLVGSSWVRAASFEPVTTGLARNGHLPVHMVIEQAVATRDTIIVLFGEGGLACRTVNGVDAVPGPFLEWLERKKNLPHAVREYAAACLCKAHQDPDAASILHEMQVLAPIARRQVLGAASPVAADIEVAIGAGDKGVFYSGWARDPHGLVEKLAIVSTLGTRSVTSLPSDRFPRQDVEKRLRASQRNASEQPLGLVGFAAGLVDAAPALQYRFELLLRSGTRIDIVPPPQPPSLADRRAAVLGCVPGPYVTKSLLETCIAPAVEPLHRAYMETCRAPDLVTFGQPPEKPDVSVIVPLYRNLEFIRFQMAAFAVDPDFRRTELIYVLDSPEQRLQVEHLLLGMHGLYGIPMQLAVMSGNYGYAAANNQAAKLARGEYLVLLNSDVVPDRRGWISTMMSGFQTDPGIGIVGPKLLYEDGSLQHAGMYFGRDLKGEWLNQHYYKGFPRGFALANIARSVPAVTGACLMIRRAVFEQVSGFTEDYVIGDYEDSDLCLKVRRGGLDILYQPEAELYHFERKSISRHSGYMRSVASEYNRWLHGRRWSDLMTALMANTDGVCATGPRLEAPIDHSTRAGR